MIQHNSPSTISSDVVAISIATLTITESVLTMEQKSTFESNIREGFTGKILLLSAANPSRLIFVAQKVFVKILNTNTINRDAEEDGKC